MLRAQRSGPGPDLLARRIDNNSTGKVVVGYKTEIFWEGDTPIQAVGFPMSCCDRLNLKVCEWYGTMRASLRIALLNVFTWDALNTLGCFMISVSATSCSPGTFSNGIILMGQHASACMHAFPNFRFEGVFQSFCFYASAEWKNEESALQRAAAFFAFWLEIAAKNRLTWISSQEI